MTTLNINFIKALNDEQTVEFYSAIDYAFDTMSIKDIENQIATLDKKIKNEKGNYSEEQIVAFESEKVKLENSMSEFEFEKVTLEPYYNKVISVMTEKNEQNFRNDEKSVKNVLNILATVSNPKLTKYALAEFECPTLYNCLENIRLAKPTSGGYIKNSADIKASYQSIRAELENIFKNAFSLPFETVYTNKTRVKLNADDIKLLVDCYVKGFKNIFKYDEKSDTVTFNGRQVQTLCKAKVNKKTKKVTINYAPLIKVIVDLVVGKYFA